MRLAKTKYGAPIRARTARAIKRAASEYIGRSALTSALCRAEEGAQRRSAGVGHQRAVRAHAFPYLRPHNTGTLNDLELMNPSASPAATATHHHGEPLSKKATTPTRPPATAP